MSDTYLHSDQLYTLGVWEGLRMSWSLGGFRSTLSQLVRNLRSPFHPSDFITG